MRKPHAYTLAARGKTKIGRDFFSGLTNAISGKELFAECVTCLRRQRGYSSSQESSSSTL